MKRHSHRGPARASQELARHGHALAQVIENWGTLLDPQASPGPAADWRTTAEACRSLTLDLRLDSATSSAQVYAAPGGGANKSAAGHEQRSKKRD